MKEVIKFTLKGNTACIRKPESNDVYFTYNFLHKIMITGILGAIIGENGYNYNQFYNINDLPDSYKNLINLKIALKPNAKYGKIHKKIQKFNNSVGYASKEEGGNLIVTEQWLENPSYDIYILSDASLYYNKIKEYLLNSKCEYIPFLGKNDHFAVIENVNILNASEIKNSDKLDSIFNNSTAYIDNDNLDDLLFEYNTNDNDVKFEYNEVLPTKLNKDIGYTDYTNFTYTNKKVNIIDYTNIYNVNNNIIAFY